MFTLALCAVVVGCVVTLALFRQSQIDPQAIPVRVQATPFIPHSR